MSAHQYAKYDLKGSALNQFEKWEDDNEADGAQEETALSNFSSVKDDFIEMQKLVIQKINSVD